MNTLKDTSVGKTVKVVKLHGDGPLKRRVMDMGITKGVEIYVRKVAPLGDPVEIRVRGYELSIRRADAEIVEVEEASKRTKPSAPATQPSAPAAPAPEPDDSREIKIALAGDPNCGKTTLFNALTGGAEYVGNWAGVTVEKKEGRMKGRRHVVVQDLPGIYSLSPYSPEEVVTRTYLVDDRPDAMINIVDGTNLERNLYLTTQLLELGIPTVVAVNMMDVVRKSGDDIDFERLSREIRCPVMPISALTGEGVREVAAKAIALARAGHAAERPHVFTGSVEHAIAHIEESIQGKVPERSIRWYAIKIFERDEKAIAGLGLDKELLGHLDEHVVECEKEMDDDCVSIIIDQRYARVKELTDLSLRRRRRTGLTLSDNIDRIMTNRILALPIFAAVIWLMYYVSVTLVGSWTADWSVGGLFGEWLAKAGVPPESWVHKLVFDVVFGGVGTVLSFVPQIVVIFLFLGFLEDCGYMSRVAFIMDRLFRKFGLSGKSFIPILVGMGCGVPAILATRTIEAQRDRRMTIMLGTYIPCGAKAAIIAMFVPAFFSRNAWVASAMYFAGIGVIVLGGLILKKSEVFAGDPAPFVMELPPYHLPTFYGLVRHTWDRTKGYIVKAGTIIFAACTVLWVLMHFTWGLHYVDDTLEESILASIGNSLRWLFVPLGFGRGGAGAVASLTAGIAKEEAAATLAMLSGAGAADAGGAGPALNTLFGQLNGAGLGTLAALSFLLFNLFNPPCMVAVVTAFREMGSAKWGWICVGFHLLVGYALALVVYQLGALWITRQFGFWTAVAFALVAAVVWLVVRPAPNNIP